MDNAEIPWINEIRTKEFDDLGENAKGVKMMAHGRAHVGFQTPQSLPEQTQRHDLPGDTQQRDRDAREEPGAGRPADGGTDGSIDEENRTMGSGVWIE